MVLFYLVSYFLHAKLLQWCVIISYGENSDIFKMYIKNSWTSNLQICYGSETYLFQICFIDRSSIKTYKWHLFKSLCIFSVNKKEVQGCGSIIWY